LEHLTFANASFDIVITQDVLEHVLDPASAFTEIRRVLRPDGCHIWTVPIYDRPITVVRARRRPDGSIEHMMPPDYHGNPLGGGSLVVREWGDDIVEFVDRSADTTTVRHTLDSWRLGVRGPMTDVLVTYAKF
jgi:SAM-dependent methyltransferase